jgi:hypothetical protein
VGVAGLATVVLVFVPAIVRSGGEPEFDATANQALAFFRSVNTPAAELEEVVSTVGLVAFLWFAVGLGSLLRTVEPGLPWRAGVVPASAAVVVTLGLVGDWDAAAYRAADLDPQVARFAFDMGNRSFANGWVALGASPSVPGLVDQLDLVPSLFPLLGLGHHRVGPAAAASVAGHECRGPPLG